MVFVKLLFSGYHESDLSLYLFNITAVFDISFL
jgi:hypothetical protein